MFSSPNTRFGGEQSLSWAPFGVGTRSTLTLILFNKYTQRLDSYTHLTTNTAAEDSARKQTPVFSLKQHSQRKICHLYTPHPRGLHLTPIHSAGRVTPKGNLGKSVIKCNATALQVSPIIPCPSAPNLPRYKRSSTQELENLAYCYLSGAPSGVFFTLDLPMLRAKLLL